MFVDPAKVPFPGIGAAPLPPVHGRVLGDEIARLQQEQRKAAANLQRRSTLPDVAMPLVRLMGEEGLSWSEIEEIAGVVRSLTARSRALREEQRHLSGMAGQARQAWRAE